LGKITYKYIIIGILVLINFHSNINIVTFDMI
jgi:hypothetical protein